MDGFVEGFHRPWDRYKELGMICTSRRLGVSPGFTLIELLVVIAIISLLAAILFPVFAQAREKARQSTCVSNQKQIGLAMLQYNQDYDEMYPIAFYGSSASGTPVSWPLMIQPYVKNAQIFTCPSESDDFGITPGTFSPATPNGILTTYAYNFYIGANNNTIYTKSLPEFNKPAQTVLLVDGTCDPRGAYATTPGLWKKPKRSSDTSAVTETTGPNSGTTRPTTKNRTGWLIINAGSTSIGLADYGAPVARHTEMTNVLWADGHVKASRIEKIYKLIGQPEEANRPGGASVNWSPCLEPAFGCPN
jgi:prepilin-type N-terminal cleavage/methylation domain-containing protein/prepilin-type processing-associated H-X9-DG protein